MTTEEMDRIKELASKVDWSEFKWPVSGTATCSNCDTEYRSHAKLLRDDGSFILVSKDGCRCGCHLVRNYSGDGERWTL